MKTLMRPLLLISILIPLSQVWATLPACLDGFTLYSNTHTLLGDRDSLASGKSGSNGYTELGIDGRSQADFVSRGNIKLRDRSRITGNAKSGGSVTLLSGAQVTGTITQGASVPICALPTETFSVGTANFTVSPGTTKDLLPGAYGDYRVSSNGILKLRQGTYRFKSLVTEADGRLQLNPGTGKIEVFTSVSLAMGDRTQFNFIGGEAPEKVKFHSQQSTPLFIGTDIHFKATVVAPLAEIHIFSRTRLMGSAFGGSIVCEPDVRFFSFPYGPGNDLVTITSPINGFLTNQTSMAVAWTVNGAIQSTLTTETLALEGSNKVKRCSGTSCDSISVIRDTQAPVVHISNPLANQSFNTSQVQVAWNVDGTAQSTQLTQNLTVEGPNWVVRTITDAAGNIGRDSVLVFRDLAAPTVAILSPAPGQVFRTPIILVSWSVDGALQSTQISEALNVGANILKRIGADAAGNLDSATITVYLDTVPPLVEIVSPLAGAFINETSTAVVWKVDGVEQTTELSQALTEGNNTLVRMATDAAGNIGTASITVIRDTQAPVVIISNPQTDQIFNTSQVQVAWTVDGTAQSTLLIQSLSVEGPNWVVRTFTDAAGNIGRDSVLVSRDLVAPTVAILSPAPGQIFRTPTISVSWSVDGEVQSTQTSEALHDGTNILKRIGTDAAGNQDSAMITVFLDAVPPLVEIVSPLAGAFINETSTVVVWKVDGVEQTSATSEGLSLEGLNTITRTATDAAGNTGSASITVIRDTQAPIVVISEPNPDQLFNTNQVQVAWSVDGVPQSVQTSQTLADEGLNWIVRASTDAAGNVGRDSVLVSRDLVAPTVAILSPAPWQIFRTPTISVSWSVDGAVQTTQTSEDLHDGINVLKRIGTDAAGNQDSVLITVYLDTVPPLVEIVSPLPSAFIKETYTAVVWKVDGVEQTTATSESLSIEGLNNITRTATDAAGNTGSVSVSVIRDTQAPVVVITSPSNGDTAAGPTVQIQFTADGQAQMPFIHVLQVGLNSIIAQMTDAAGNTGADTVQVFFQACQYVANQTLHYNQPETRNCLVIQNGGRLYAHMKLTVDSIRVEQGGQLFTDDTLQARKVVVRSGGLVTHSAFTASDTGYRVHIRAATITLDSAAVINVNGKGYPIGSGPGGQRNATDYTSGSHAGNGQSSPFPAYGNYLLPDQAGSGGGLFGSAAGHGGPGGGVVRLMADTIAVNGSILADGIATQFGSGAGGSIWLDATVLTGTGSATANGGLSNYYGSGGRIAVYANTLPTAFKLKLKAKGYGGGSIYLIEHLAARELRVDTAFGGVTGGFPAVTDSNLSVKLNSGSKSGFLGNTRVKDLTWSGAANAVFSSKLQARKLSQAGGTVEMADTCRIDTVLLEAASVLTHKAGSSDTVWKLTVVADTLHIASGASINVGGRGYANGRGPNGYQSLQQYRGGVHASGGNSSILAAYDDPYMPAIAGSGGADFSSATSVGANGGGTVRVIARRIGLDGQIRADGTVANFYGSGAGGSVWLTADGLSGSGSITANGGLGSYPGGGGRIAVYADTLSALLRKKATAKGFGGGTVYLQDQHGYKEFRVDTSYGSGATPIATSLYDSTLLLRLNNLSKTFFTGNTLVKDAVWSGGANATFPGKVQMRKLSQAGGTVEVADTCLIDTVLLEATSVLTHKAGAGDSVWKLTVLSDTVHIASSASINVGGRGYANGRGPNGYTSTQLYRGGTHGGAGYGSNLAPYDDPFMPEMAGGGGADYSSASSVGANGGGIVRVAARKIALDGQIRADGGQNNFFGSGAGGSVWLTADGVTGSGLITANGGQGSYFGGGGRVAITSCDVSTAIRQTARATGYAVGSVKIPCFDNPVVQILSPAENEILYKDTVPVVWQANGQVIHSDTIAVLQEGPNSIIRCFTNTFGNTGCDTAQVWVDLSPPIVEILTPANNSYTISNTVAVTWTVDGVLQPASNANLVEGVNLLIRSYTDTSGSRGADTARVTRDTKPPVIAPISPGQSGITLGSNVSIRWSSDSVEQLSIPYVMDTANLNSVMLRAVDSAGNRDSLQLYFYPGTLVPDLLGKTSAEAESLLIATGVGAENTWVDNDTVPTGIVFMQTPTAGDSIRLHWPVQYRISRGLDAVDLVPLVLAADSMTVDPLTLAAGGFVRVMAANLGRIRVDAPFNVLIFEDRNRDKRFNHDTDLVLGQVLNTDLIDAGDSLEITIPVSGGLTFNGNRISVMLDFADSIAEVHEDNNITQTLAKCKQLPFEMDYTPKLLWGWKSNVPGDYGYVFTQPLVANLNDDDGDGKIDENDNPDVLIYAEGLSHRLLSLAGADGQIQWDRNISVYNWAAPAIGDLDGDHVPEIVVVENSPDGGARRLLVLDNEGIRKDSSEWFQWGSWGFPGHEDLTLSDMDADGKSEILWAQNVFDRHAKLVYPVKLDRYFLNAIPIDIDGDGFQEILAQIQLDGDLNARLTVISFKEKRNLVHSNSVMTWYPMVAVADTGTVPIILDPLAHGANVVYDSIGNVNSYSLSGEIGKKYPPVHLTGPGFGPLYTGGNDELNYFGSGSRRAYFRLGRLSMSLSSDPGRNFFAPYFSRTDLRDSSVNYRVFPESIFSSGTVFDLNDDGNPEAIMVTSDSIYIMDSTGASLASIASPSFYSGSSGLVISDLNKDGHADILVSSSRFRDTNFTFSVYSNPTWVGARAVYNQYDYNIDHVNDDNTIPRFPGQYWKTHNTVRIQCTEGHYACVDASASFPQMTINDSGRYEITARIGNGGATQIPAGIPIAVYSGLSGTESLLTSTFTTRALRPGEYYTFKSLISESVRGNFEFRIAIDDSGNGHGVLDENDEANNSVLTQFLVNDKKPVLAQIADQYTEPGVPFSLAIQATDEDGDPLLYRLTRSTPGMTIDSLTGLIQWTSANNPPRCTVTVTATDPFSQFASATFLIFNGGATNQPPVITSTPSGTAGINLLSTTVAEVYRYTIVASDAEGEEIEYYVRCIDCTHLASAMPQLSGNKITWVPFHPPWNDNDSIRLEVTVRDARGGLDTQTFTIHLIRTQNTAPVFIAPPVTVSTEGQAWTSPVTIFDLDEDPVTIYLDTIPLGVGYTSGNLHWVPTLPGNFVFRIGAADQYDTTWQRFIVTVSPVNDAPRITSVAPLGAISGALYSYPIVALDEENDALTYTLVNGPPDMSVSTQGLVQWRSPQSRTAPANVTVRVQDPNGGEVAQTWQIAMRPDDVPPTLAIRFSQNPVRPGDSVTVSLDAYDNVDLTASSLSLEGSPVTLTNGSYVFTPLTAGTYSFTAQATDPLGNIGTANGLLRASESANVSPPLVTISHTPVNPVAGDRVTFQVSVSDTDGVDSSRIWVAVDGLNLPVLNGEASYDALRPGNFEAKAVGYDLLGNSALAVDAFFVGPQGGDAVAPTAEITSPEDDTVLYGQADIFGTAYDANLAYYTLSHRDLNASLWTEYYRATENVQGAKIGIVDATTLVNGDYEIRLDVYDRSGNSISRTVQIKAAGEKKVGPFTLAFQDLTIPMSGLEVSVSRTYDSRIKTQGDFGIGWQMGLRSIRLSENRNQGVAWNINRSPGLVPQYSISGAKTHTVTVTMPGGRTQEFSAEPHFFSAYNPTFGVMRYTPKPGTYSTLQPIEVDTFVVMGGEFFDQNGDFQEPFNPQVYKLTLLDGSYFIIDQVSGGVVESGDLNGNKVSWGPNAIRHNAGESIDFTRDEVGRIASISDRAGRGTQYRYDVLGNLSEVVDAEGNATKFKYAPNSYLAEIFDARGIRAARTEYDEEGRVIRQINANGDTLSMNHDLAANTEEIEDYNGHRTTFIYDSAGNVLSKTDHANHTWSYAYDSAGNLLSTTQPGGASKSSTFDAKGNELTSTDELGHTTTREYDNQGHVTLSRDPQGRITQYLYDTKGNLEREIGPNNQVQSQRTYDPKGNMLTETDALNHVTSHTYTPQGWLASTKDARNQTTYIGHDNVGNTAFEVNASGDTTRYAHDKNGNRILTVDAAGDTTRTEYNAISKVVKQTDALGRVTRFVYNNLGDKVQDIAPDSAINEREYDAQGNVSAIYDPLNRVTRMQYDFENRVVRTTNPDNSFTRTVYDALGRRIESFDANNNSTQYEYDDTGNNTLVREALGNETHFEYDILGRKSAMVDALNQRIQYSYDLFDRLTTTTFPDGSTKVTAYDAAGRKILERDQNLSETRFEYDEVGNLSAVVDNLNHRTEYTYDANNNRLTQKDAKGHTTNMEYDVLGRMVRKTYPNGEEERWTYDANGNSLSHAKGNDSTAYEYDDRNRETKRTHFPGGHEVVTTYTLDGKRETVTAYNGKSEFAYDNRGRLFREDMPNGDFLEHRYDVNGNRTSLTTPFGVTGYRYDELNRMDSVVSPQNQVTEYRYSAVGNRDSVINANGTTVGYTYDTQNRLTELRNRNGSGILLSRYQYSLNYAGIRTGVLELDGSQVIYGYDGLYRLMSESRTGSNAYTNTFTYDNVGNRLTQTKGGVTTAYDYNTRDQLLSESNPLGSTTYSYDPAGRMVSKTDATGTTTYAWVDEDRMASVSGPGVAVSYQYDADGRRVKETSGAVVKQYLIDRMLPYGQVVLETDGANELVAEFTYGLERISQSRDGESHFYQADGQGSVRQLTDSVGVVSDTYFYSAFGETLASTGTTANDFRYVGEQFDGNSGFYYNRARWYNNTAGRFVSVDPDAGKSANPISLHRYLYANASPLSFSDPTGEFSLSVVLATISVSNIMAASYKPTLNANRCGRDVTTALNITRSNVISTFQSMPEAGKKRSCDPFKNPSASSYGSAISGWDLSKLTQYWADNIKCPGLSSSACFETAKVGTGKYNVWDINYISFGWICQECDISEEKMNTLIRLWRAIGKSMQGKWPASSSNPLAWAKAGYNNSILPGYTDPRYGMCKDCGEKPLNEDLGSVWPFEQVTGDRRR